MADHDEHTGCAELLGALSDYIDGTAEAALCAEIEQHLEGCDNCRVVVDTLNKTVLLYRELPEQDVPDDVQDRLLRILDIGPASA
ncbi:MAG: anti-sigma factor family protein [Caldilineaceae bacterium]